MDYSKDGNQKRKKNAKSKKKKARNKIGVMIFRVFVAVFLIGCFAVGGAAVGAYIGILEAAPELDYNVSILPENYVTIVYDDTGREFDRFTGEENREYVSLDQIPANMRNAFIAIEDERFYSHNGIDVKGMGRAVYSTLFQNERQGASTITQQLIKNNVLNIQRNTMDTKIQEQYLAVKYESLLEERLGSKEEAKNHILEAYLNTIGLNHGLNGVQTAAKYYFNTDVSELNLAQCAVIAAITQNPTYYSPAVNPDNNRVRQGTVLYKMLELEFISQAEYDEAVAMEDAVYEGIGQYRDIADEVSNIHNYFADQIIEEIASDLQEQGIVMTSADAYKKIYNGGLQIYSTMNVGMQNLLEDTFNDDSFFSQSDYRIDVTHIISYKNTVTDAMENVEETSTVRNMDEAAEFVRSVQDKYLVSNTESIAERTIYTPQPQAAMVVLDYHNGHVKAIIGGRGEKTTNRGFNRATHSKRQPGSVFKVLAAYAPAIDMGIVSPGSIIIDEPIDFNGYKPGNWTGNYKGAVTVREGVVNSMNVVTVKVLAMVGIETSYNYLERFGFTTLVDFRDGKTDKGYALALGGLTDGVTQLEVTAAYGTIANDGVYLKPTFYTKVLDHDNNVLLEYDPEIDRREVLKRDSALMLTDMMKDAVTSGTGARARLTNVNMPVAGKTGTSQKTNDLTFVGYTPYYVSGIWLGYDRERNMTDGASYHLAIWKHVMENIHENLELRSFDRPESTTQVSICLDSGLRAVSGLCDQDARGGRVKSEAFVAGGGPSEYCNVHASVEIDTLTGRLATAATPSERRTKIVGIVTPDADITVNDYEIPQSMVNGNTTTMLNSNYENRMPQEGDYYFDPETGEIRRRGDEESDDELPVIETPDTTFPTPSPQLPAVETPAATQQPTPPENVVTPEPTPVQQQFTDVPEFNTPPPVTPTDPPPVIDSSTPEPTPVDTGLTIGVPSN